MLKFQNDTHFSASNSHFDNKYLFSEKNIELEALKSLCRSPWSMCIFNKRHRWINDKIVFWCW